MIKEIRKILDLELVWPARENTNKLESAWGYYQNEEHLLLPQTISKLVSRKRSVIQAGGHVGLYPIQYSKLFEKVYTFEPHSFNYSCLEENTKPYENILIHNVGLGDKESIGSMKLSRKNSGAHHVSKSNTANTPYTESIKIVTIDSFGVDDCDLIHLDLEGYELFALQGAINTIEKSAPIIVLETTSTVDRYGYNNTDLETFLSGLGYSVVEKWENDTVYAKG